MEDRHENWLIDIDSRVRYLENLHTPSLESYEPKPLEVKFDPWTDSQWEYILQLRSEVIEGRKKLAEVMLMFDRKKKTKSKFA